MGNKLDFERAKQLKLRPWEYKSINEHIADFQKGVRDHLARVPAETLKNQHLSSGLIQLEM